VSLAKLERLTGKLREQFGRPIVTITVPHAVCRNQADIDNHYCDVVAAPVGRAIADKLQDSEFHPNLLMPTISRMEVDMNRPVARGQSFRTQVDEALGTSQYLLDVHSFPELGGPWSVDCYLLKLKYGANNDEVVYDLADHLITRGINCAVVSAEKENDVVLSAVERGIPATLVEFSEPVVNSEGINGRLVSNFVEGFQAFLKTRGLEGGRRGNL
jgi:hypothetical protein